MAYVSARAGGRPGQLGATTAAALPGMPRLSELVDPSLLSSLPAAVYTPWAAQESDLEWIEITRPDTNILVMELGPAMAILQSISLGLPGFVAVIADAPISASAAERAFEGTRYDLHSIQAAYRQDDPSPTPRIAFLYWGGLADPRGGSPLPLNPASFGPGARLVFAQPIEAVSSSRRSAPSFFAAADAQFPGLAPSAKAPMIPPVGPPPPDLPGSPAATRASSFGTTLLVGAGVALATFAVVALVRRAQ